MHKPKYVKKNNKYYLVRYGEGKLVAPESSSARYDTYIQVPKKEYTNWRQPELPFEWEAV